MNLSERLAKAAEDRRREHEATRRVHLDTVGSFTPEAITEFDSATAPLPDFVALPDVAADPVDATEVEPMKMRLPDAADEPTIATGPLPLWERPVADLLRDAPLATVTPLPVVPRDDMSDDDLDDAELARPIPIRGEWMPADDEVDLDELYVPPLAAAESAGLAGIALRSEDEHVVDGDTIIDLDDVTVDAAQRPRITFGPLDVRDDNRALTVDSEYLCPQCGGAARVDIHDPMRGRIHLSCDSCFKMWQEAVEATVDVDEPFMRD